VCDKGRLLAAFKIVYQGLLQRDASFAGQDKAVDPLNVFDGNHWLSDRLFAIRRSCVDGRMHELRVPDAQPWNAVP
jgi:hypothetical protein